MLFGGIGALLADTLRMLSLAIDGLLPSSCQSTSLCDLRSAVARADGGQDGCHTPGSRAPALRRGTLWHCRHKSFAAAHGQASRVSEARDQPTKRPSGEPLGKGPRKTKPSKATTVKHESPLPSAF